MSRNRSRLTYRARKRRQRRIILGVCTLAAFFLVCGGLMMMLHSGGFSWFGKKDPSKESDRFVDNETDQTPEATEPAESEQSTEAPTEPEPPAVLAIEDVWQNDTRQPVEVRGVYLSAAAATRSDTVDYVFQLLDTTEINAVVIDIKDDEGYLTVDLGIPLATEIEANRQVAFKSADELKALLSKFREHGAYLIARIAAFRDKVLAQAKTDCSLWWKTEYGGTIYVDSQDYYWLDPGDETVRQYLLDVSNAAVELGFDEIQYDYVRFPTTYIGRVDYYGGTGYYNADNTYNEEAATLRKDTITSYVEFVCRELVPKGVFVSADVYGTIIGSSEDGGNVGQDYAALAKWLDYICPMVYPSHYTSPIYGVDYPDTEPYTIVHGAMKDSVEELSRDPGQHCAIVRPWMQTFTASWLTHHIEYGGTELRQQIDAVYDAGYTEWLLWNSSGKYEKYSSGIKAK